MRKKESAALLERNRSNVTVLKGILAVIDRGRFKWADYLKNEIQNAYFEGFTQQVEVTSIFVFNLKAEVIFATMNYPGFCSS